MSHIVQVKNVEMTDQVAREMAVGRMENARYVKPARTKEQIRRGEWETAQSEAEATGKHDMYGSQTAVGVGVKFDGWAHPVVITTDGGQAQYDSYGAQSGTRHAIDELTAYYASEKAKIDAQLRGICLEEVETEDEIKLVAMVD